MKEGKRIKNEKDLEEFHRNSASRKDRLLTLCERFDLDTVSSLN